MPRVLYSREACERGAAIIQGGGLVAFPTETYYGLAVDPFNGAALERLFRLKGRPDDKAVLALIGALEDIGLLAARREPLYDPLMASLWPGPLTLVFAAHDNLPRLLTGGSATVALRLSSHPAAQELIAAAAQPITATSANISGEQPAVSAHEVEGQFPNGIDLIIDGGSTPGGAGSTIVGVKGGSLRVIRDGALDIAPFLT